jgi:hypothetical protein
MFQISYKFSDGIAVRLSIFPPCVLCSAHIISDLIAFITYIAETVQIMNLLTVEFSPLLSVPPSYV